MKNVSRFVVLFALALVMAGCVSVNFVSNKTDHLQPSLQEAPEQFAGDLTKVDVQIVENIPQVVATPVTPAVIPATSATDDTTEAAETKLRVLESKGAQEKEGIADLNARLYANIAEIAKLNARLDAITAEIANLEAQIAAARQSISMTAETPALAQEITLVQVATFTRHNLAAGWSAWERQSREYHKANPWPKLLAENCAREPSICKRTARTGTAFYLPAPEVRVIVPAGMKAPEAIALVPTEILGVLALDMKTPVVTMREKELASEVAALTANADTTNTALLIALALLVSLFFVFILLANANETKKRLLRERDDEIARLKRIPPTLGNSASNTTESGCCKETPQTPGAGSDAETGCCCHTKNDPS